MSQGRLEKPGAGRNAAALVPLFVCLAAAGCRSVPWEPPPAVPAAGWDAEAVRTRFEAALAPRFELMNNVVFRFGRMEIAGIGLVSVERPQRSFRLACMTPLGVKLFEVSGGDNAAECRFAMGGLGPAGEVARAVADDVRRVYFGLTPSPTATLARQRQALVFTEPQDGGLVEYVFAGSAQRLTEKRLRKNGRVAWEILYGPYGEEEGRLIPDHVQIRNMRYGYTLTVRPSQGL